nr:fibrinogen-like protein 1 isoform X2 [Styela clava]
MQLEEKLTSILMNIFDGDLVINTQIFENVERSNLIPTTTDRDGTTDNNAVYSSSPSPNDVITNPLYSAANGIHEKAALSTRMEITTALTKYTWGWPLSTDQLITTDKDDIGHRVTTDTDSTPIQSSTLSTFVDRTRGSSLSEYEMYNEEINRLKHEVTEAKKLIENYKIDTDASTEKLNLDKDIKKYLERSRYLPDSCRGLHKLNLFLGMKPEKFLESTVHRYLKRFYRDLMTDDGGWVVFQRRMDGSENFYREWYYYKKWIWKYNWRILAWSCISRTFSIGDSSTNYRLTIGQYSGNAGDSLRHSQHQGQSFTTRDEDHDSTSGNCAVNFEGAFRYGGCHATNLNELYIAGGKAEYGISVVWWTWKGHIQFKWCRYVCSERVSDKYANKSKAQMLWFAK